MKAKRPAICGVLAALALIFLAAACIAPSGRLGLAAAAGLFPAFAVVAGGLKYGFLCWAASGLLGVVLMPNKGIALLFLTVLGLYPVLKSPMEHIKRRWTEWLCKLAFFNVALTVLWLLFRGFLLLFLPHVLENGVLLYIAGNIVFVTYDVGLSRLLTFYAKQVQKGLHKR